MSELIIASKEGYPYPEGISFKELHERAVISERDRVSLSTAKQSHIEIQRILVKQILIDRLNIFSRYEVANFIGRSVLYLARCYQTRYAILSMQDSLIFLGAAVASGFPAELMANLWLHQINQKGRVPSANLVRNVFETTNDFQSEGVSGNYGALMNLARAFEYYPFWRDLSSWQNFVHLIESSYFGNIRKLDDLIIILNTAFVQLGLSYRELHSLEEERLDYQKNLRPHETGILVRFNLDLARVLHCLALLSTSLNVDLSETVNSISYFEYLRSIGIRFRDILFLRLIEKKPVI